MAEFRWLRRKRTDEEFIEMTRTFLRRWDKFKILMSLVSVGLLVGCFVTAGKVVETLMGFQPGAGPAIVGGMALGTVVGMTFGFMIYHCIEFLAKAILGDYRAERQMLKYHDALLDVAQAHSGEAMPPQLAADSGASNAANHGIEHTT